MSYQEKNITVSLVNFSLILVYFLVRIAQLNLNGNFLPENVFRLWATTIILSIVVTVAGTILTHIASAVIEVIRTGSEEPEIDDTEDERDKLIDLKGEKLAHIVHSVGVFLAMLAFALGQPALVMFSGLILAGLLGQVVGDSYRIVLYRRGL